MGAKPRDRITQIRIRDFRCLADVSLDLSGLSVLIGDNGSGKSSIVEAIETLRYFAGAGANTDEYFRDHPRPVRGTAGEFTLGVLIESEAGLPRLDYEFAISRERDGQVRVHSERLDIGPIGEGTRPLRAIHRTLGHARVLEPSGQLADVSQSSERLLLADLSSAPRVLGSGEMHQEAARRVVAALRGIEVHIPFEVMPAWAARRTQRRSASREAIMLQPAQRLELLAANLGNVYHSLKNDHGTSHWSETMELVRLGLGTDVDDVVASADASGGQHAIAVRYKASGSVPAAALSDGTLAYLAFVALARLPSERSLLAFDEPELHLHPALLVRVVSMLEAIARRCPVVLTTHSDRLLDALAEPAKAAVLCELDTDRATRLVRPDPAMLAKWLTDFRGLGDLRAAGLQSAVMEVKEPDA